QIETVDPFLAVPALGALYHIPVVIVRFLPTNDGLNVDGPLTNWYSTLADLRQRVDRHTIQTKFILEQGSRFRGYSIGQTAPSLGYRIVQIISVYEDLPPGKPVPGAPGLFFPDYYQILTRFNAQQFVEQQGVKE